MLDRASTLLQVSRSEHWSYLQASILFPIPTSDQFIKDGAPTLCSDKHNAATRPKSRSQSVPCRLDPVRICFTCFPSHWCVLVALIYLHSPVGRKQLLRGLQRTRVILM